MQAPLNSTELKIMNARFLADYAESLAGYARSLLAKFGFSTTPTELKIMDVLGALQINKLALQRNAELLSMPGLPEAKKKQIIDATQSVQNELAGYARSLAGYARSLAGYARSLAEFGSLTPTELKIMDTLCVLQTDTLTLQMNAELLLMPGLPEAEKKQIIDITQSIQNRKAGYYRSLAKIGSLPPERAKLITQLADLQVQNMRKKFNSR